MISTHLFEIAGNLQQSENATFKHMKTIVEDDQFRFTYQLIDGISNKRIGLCNMKQDDVLKMQQEL